MSAFHKAMSAYLRGVDHPQFSAPGFSVYRNTVTLGLLDALAANYPSVLKTLGIQSFERLSFAYLRAHPNQQTCLMHCGEYLTEYIAIQSLALSELAMLDRGWMLCHQALDALPLMSASMQAFMESTASLYLHPSTQIFYFKGSASAMTWHSLRYPDKPQSLEAQGILLTRIEGHVEGLLIDQLVVTLAQAFTKPHRPYEVLNLLAAQADEVAAGKALFLLCQQHALTTLNSTP